MFTLNRKSLLVFTLLISLNAVTVHAGPNWFKEKKEKQRQEQTLNHVLNTALPADQEAAQRDALQALANTMIPRLLKIQTLINEERSEEAWSLAKFTLDEVRVKTGIDPKVKLRENFLVSTTFDQNATSMSSLPTEQQQLVIHTVKDFRGGLYLDIINLTKRTTLLYIKAMHQDYRKNGGLNQEDIDKILRDLALATIVPMPIQDRSGKIITVFEDEVANEDHTYKFNREIKMYLTSASDLKITEEAFIKYREQLKLSFGGGKKEKSEQNQENNGMKCMNHADKIVYSGDADRARIACFKRHYEKTFNYEDCIQLADRIEYSGDADRARIACFKRFNP